MLSRSLTFVCVACCFQWLCWDIFYWSQRPFSYNTPEVWKYFFSYPLCLKSYLSHWCFSTHFMCYYRSISHDWLVTHIDPCFSPPPSCGSWGTSKKGRRCLSRNVLSVTRWQRMDATRWDPICGVCLGGRQDRHLASLIHRPTLIKVCAVYQSPHWSLNLAFCKH